MKRKGGPGPVNLAAAVEAAKRKADARVQTIWEPDTQGLPQTAPETNFGSEADARETLVSRGAHSVCFDLCSAHTRLTRVCCLRALRGAGVRCGS